MKTRANLRSYQERASRFIKEHPSCALWAEMGLGKTISMATAFSDLRDGFRSKRMLIIGPLRVARGVWSREIEEWDHVKHLKLVKIIGTERERLAAIDAKASVHTINRENVTWLVNQFVKDKKQVKHWPWDLVVLDESSSFKSSSAKRWKSLRKIRRLFPRCVELTGTPAPNGLEDLWAQIFLLDQGERLGRTKTAFRERWFSPPPYQEFGKWTAKPHAFREIMAAVSDIVLTLRAEDYLELPPVLNNIVRVQLPEAAMGAYKRMEKRYITETFKGRVVTAVNAAVCAGKLLQLANGAIYLDERKSFETLHDEKIDALLEILEEAEGPVLICYNFVSDLARLGEALSGLGKTWDLLKSEQSIERWNAGKTDYLVMHPASAGHGLNLQHSGANTIVWFGLGWNLEFYQQANARLTGGLRREGRSIVIHHIVADGTIDDRVVRVLTGKATTQEDLMKGLVELTKE